MCCHIPSSSALLRRCFFVSFDTSISSTHFLHCFTFLLLCECLFLCIYTNPIPSIPLHLSPTLEICNAHAQKKINSQFTVAHEDIQRVRSHKQGTCANFALYSWRKMKNQGFDQFPLCHCRSVVEDSYSHRRRNWGAKGALTPSLFAS